MHLPALIQDLANILVVAGIVTVIFHRIRQPVVLGYIVAGVIVGPHTPPFPLVKDLENIRTLAELGVIFLMFTLGLEFSFRKLLRIGAAASTTALIEVGAMTVMGYGLARLLGFSQVVSIFFGGMVSISSTSIIVRAFDELGLKAKRFAELTLGVLIVEDLLAILMMVAGASIAATGEVSGEVVVRSAGRLALVTGGWMLLGYFIVPRIVRYVGRLQSEETLSIVSLGLCLALVSVGAALGYSAALGAFIMGSLLAESTESRRIEGLMKPLKDLFAAIFFVSVGMMIDLRTLVDQKGAVLAFSLLVMCGKVFAATFGCLIAGQKFKTAVLVGFSLAQIGEFSFIIAGVGRVTGAISDQIFALAVAVSAITTFFTPYSMRLAPKVAALLEAVLPQNALRIVEAYSSWRSRLQASRVRGPEFTGRMVKWLVAAFVVVLAHAAQAEYLLPWLKSIGRNQPYILFATWAATMVVCAPFLWAMFSAFRGYQSLPMAEVVASGDGNWRKDSAHNGKSAWSVTMPVISFVLMGFLSAAYFPVRYVVLASALFSALFIGQLYRQLERSYRWMEEGFLVTFKNQGPKTKGKGDIFKILAPWDARLARIKVHADSFIVGQRLDEVNLRKTYGVNVVALQRGTRTTVAPRPDQMIFPKDELLVLAKDDDLDRIRPLIEIPTQSIESVDGVLEKYELRPAAVAKGSPLEGKTIRQAKVREVYGALVVGIERKGKRFLNPESDLVLEKGDVLWLVGETTKLVEMSAPVKEP